MAQHTECKRYSVTEAHERLVDWVRNMDTDELARAISEHLEPWDKCCQPIAVVVFDDQGGDDDSAPYLGGKRMRVVFVEDTSDCGGMAG
jgi:hypothetical protein